MMYYDRFIICVYICAWVSSIHHHHHYYKQFQRGLNNVNIARTTGVQTVVMNGNSKLLLPFNFLPWPK